MSRIQPLELPADSPFAGNQFRGVLAHCPDVLEQWNALGDVVRFSGRLSPELKEEVRRSTAMQVGCEFCASFGAPKSEHTDPREAVAVRLAKTIAEDPKKVDDALFAEVRRHFTAEETVELVAMICLVAVSGQTFGTVMKVEAANAEYTMQYAQWVEDSMAPASSAS
jgi:alkylhydroperoxidase family enzyme